MAKTEEDLLSYKSSTLPSLAVQFRNGQRKMWPLHLLGRVDYYPKNAAAEEKQTTERLVIHLLDDTVTVDGFGLDRINHGLGAGQGGVLQEFGERFESLRKPAEAYITAIAVKEG
jgi:hypothetical protein